MSGWLRKAPVDTEPMSAAPDLSRYAHFLAWLDEQGATDPDLRCAWIGGSAATGGWDEHSDLDIEALAARAPRPRYTDVC